jgi:hypothetical protein
MTTNGNGDGGLIAELDNLGDRIAVEIVSLENERAHIDAQLKRLRSLSRAIGAHSEAPKPKQKPQGKVKSKASPRAVRLIAQAIRASSGDRFTAPDLAEFTGYNGAIVYAVLNELRETETIGKAGKVPGSGPTPRIAWRVLDDEALEAVASIQAKQAANRRKS